MTAAAGLFRQAAKFFHIGPLAAAPKSAVRGARFRLDYYHHLVRARVGPPRVLYRGDSRGADVVFPEGMTPSGNHGNSIYTSEDPNVALKTPQGRGNVYEIHAPGGSWRTGRLKSAVFYGGIDRRYIKGLWSYGDRGPNRFSPRLPGEEADFIPNPYFDPPTL